MRVLDVKEKDNMITIKPNKPVENVLVRDKDNKLQQLDNGIYDTLQQLIDGYVSALQKQFDALGA